MKTVVGLFDTHAHAEKAAHDLESAGISHEDISLLANNATEQFGPNDTEPGQTTHETATEAEAGKGAVAGGVAGLLLGLAAVAIPGLGAVAAAGWLMTTVAGAVVGAGVGVVGALNGVGIPHEDAAYYNEGVKRGGTLLAVRVPDDKATQAAQILSADGAVNISERAEQYRQEGFVPPAPHDVAAPSVASSAPVAAPSVASPAPVAAPTVANPIPPSPAPLAASSPEPALHSAETVPEPNGAVTAIDPATDNTLPVVIERGQGVGHEAEHGGVRIYHHTVEYPVQEVIIVEEELFEEKPLEEELAEVELFEEELLEEELAEEELVAVEYQPLDLPTSEADLSTIQHDLHLKIARRAYELYEQRGHRDGYALDDWLDAEQELQRTEAMLV